jgi:hypothetical protein
MRTTPATPSPNHMTTVQQLAISAKREEMAVHLLNALLDAYPKAVRVDSEGSRLPLHTACAGRATPRVISTLVTAYPSAARHRNKDGFLPLHFALGRFASRRGGAIVENVSRRDRGGCQMQRQTTVP